MYNFESLSDFEFEMLCKDIMERELKINLKMFGKGKDGGIDLTNDSISKDVVVQVKHYINSNFSNLKSSLAKEVLKVQKMEPRPTQYYICCSQNLQPQNREEIYELFSEYMESDKNIYSLTDIDSFLRKEENKDIVRNHYKLWLEATDILNEISNQHVFIDCEALLYNIDEENKLFVQTAYYDEAKEVLHKERVLFLTGAPGVGKTMTTKMLALALAGEGYTIRYSTNGEIKDLKNSVSANKDKKEVIILDDCLGQHYFNIKETQESELMSLIKYVLLNLNKILLLNSRVTILNEAKENLMTFREFLDDEKINLRVLDMNNISDEDKGLIFYNHLFYKGLPVDYYNEIIINKKYKRIVRHRNYNPRIIEFVTRKVNYKGVEPKLYVNFIFSKLEYPTEIWKNEFERRLNEEDRIFMTTLYSLTETSVSIDSLERAYNNRISNQNNIDTTINIFKGVLTRLTEALVIIYDRGGKEEVGVVNPSVNDYLKIVIEENELERISIKNNISEQKQVKRMLSEDEFLELLNQGKLIMINYASKLEELNTIISNICKYKVTHENYKKNIEELFNGLEYYLDSYMIVSFLKEPLRTFYSIGNLLKNSDISSFFKDMSLLDLSDLVSSLGIFEEGKAFLIYYEKEIVRASHKAVEIFIESISVDDYYRDFNIDESIKNNTSESEGDIDIDYDTIKEEAIEYVSDAIMLEIEDQVDIINKYMNVEIEINYNELDMSVYEDEIDEFVDSYFEPDQFEYDEDNYYNKDYKFENNVDILDIIFK